MDLVNPYAERDRVTTVQGTRILQTDLGILGAEIYDPVEPTRRWFVENLYAPMPGRVLGGIRAKVIDTKGFLSFINQRDLEVSIGLSTPGDWCGWAAQDYPSPEDPEWIGICADEEDLLDDLQERELVFRGQVPGGILYPPISFTRRVHLEANNDYEEIYMLLWDMDPETGFGPDLRLETIERRWSRVERRRVRWDRI